MFVSAQSIIITLERHILETIGFDFRTRHPHRLLSKFISVALGKELGVTSHQYRDFCQLSFDMCVDMYKTDAPLKQTSSTMAVAIVKLAARLKNMTINGRLDSDSYLDSIYSDGGAVTETVFDLLDLYTQAQKNTRVGPRFNASRFVEIRLDLKEDMDRYHGYRFEDWCLVCEGEDEEARESNRIYGTRNGNGIKHVSSPPTAPPTSTSITTSVRRSRAGQDSTLRYVFDIDRARDEQEEVARYFAQDWEEYEVEVEEEIPLEPPTAPSGRGPQMHPDRERRDWDGERARHDGRRASGTGAGGSGFQGRGYSQGHAGGRDRHRRRPGPY